MSTLPETMIVTAGTETATYIKQEVCEPTELTVIQPMAAYSQRDERWKDFEYAPGYTLGRSGCLLTAIAMIGSFYYDGIITPLTVAQTLKDQGGFNKGELVLPEYVQCCYDRLHFAGRADWRDGPADMDLLREELRLFDATIILVHGNPSSGESVDKHTHFVVLRLIYDNEAEIVDPWDGQPKQLLSSGYALAGWDLARAIYGVRQFRITRDD